MPILDPAIADDTIAVWEAEDRIAGGEALFDHAVVTGVLLRPAGALVRRLLGLTLMALAAQPLDQRVGVGRAIVVDAWLPRIGARRRVWAARAALRTGKRY